jgi:hypothetical protein
MKPHILFATGMMLLLATFTFCKKNKPVGDIQAGKQLRSVRKQMFIPGGFEISRLGFEYDSRGRLTRYVNLQSNLPLETYEYSGDVPTRRVLYAFSNDRPLYSLESGSRLRLNLDKRTSASGRETYRADYRFENAQVTEIESSFTSVSPESYRIESQYFTYDQGRNMLEYSKEENNQVTVRYEVVAVDAYKNPFRELSLLVNVFGELPNFSGMGTHNVTSMYHNCVLREFEYTYNAANYPVSIRDKGESFNRYEFVYEN